MASGKMRLDANKQMPSKHVRHCFLSILSSLFFFITNYSTSEPSQLSTSYILWSQHPELVNWSKSEEICDEILASDDISTPIFADGRTWTVPGAHTDKSMANLLSNCSEFRESVPFATKPVSKDEVRHPLAYVFVGARDAAQAIRFLRVF